jgi:hypothetical protein
MAKLSLRNLIKQVLSGGLAVGSASQSLQAMPAPPTSEELPGPRSDAALTTVSPRELFLRKARPKVLLRSLDATRIALVSSHRSHRSHSSHYSGRGGESPTPAPRRPQPDRTEGRTEGRTGSSPAAQGLYGAAVAESTTLGDRKLRLGMTGKDVDQLIMLLVKAELLTAAKIPQTSLFSEDVERAVKTFQTAKGLPADGVVDYRTLLLLKVQ